MPRLWLFSIVHYKYTWAYCLCSLAQPHPPFTLIKFLLLLMVPDELQTAPWYYGAFLSLRQPQRGSCDLASCTAASKNTANFIS